METVNVMGRTVAGVYRKRFGDPSLSEGNPGSGGEENKKEMVLAAGSAEGRPCVRPGGERFAGYRSGVFEGFGGGEPCKGGGCAGHVLCCFKV